MQNKYKYKYKYDIIYVYLLTAIGLTPGGGSTVHIYTQTIHRTTQLTTRTTKLATEHTINNKNNTINNIIGKSAGPCPVFASYTLAFALQLREKHGKPSVRIAEECHLAGENRIQYVYRTERT